MQVADKAAVRAEENAQLQQPQDVAASGKGVEEKGGAGQLATGGGGMKAPVKVQPSLYLTPNASNMYVACLAIIGKAQSDLCH